MISSHEKGTALEAVVSAIESLILQAAPDTQKKPARIENRKIVRVRGVKHEMDIFVTIEIAIGYTAVFIFECKNWAEKVDKNQVIVFSEKIKACSAQQGFFVAKSFTADAVAQAKVDPRIVLKSVTEHDPASTILPFGFHYTFTTPSKVNLGLNKRGSNHSERQPLDIKSANAIVNGALIELSKYAGQWADESIAESMKTFPSGNLDDGDYSRTANSKRTFANGEFVIEPAKEDIESADLTVEFTVHIKRPAVSHFEVDGRGRVVTLEGYSFGGASIHESRFVFAV